MKIQYVVDSWHDLSTNWVISLANKFVPVFIILSIGLIAWKWTSLPPQVPIWYQKPWGAEQLADAAWLFILPVGSLTIFVINGIVASYLTKDYLVFSQILFLTSLLVSFLSFVTLAKILFIIT